MYVFLLRGIQEYLILFSLEMAFWVLIAFSNISTLEFSDKVLEDKTRAELKKVSNDLKIFNKKNQELIDDKTARIHDITERLNDLQMEKNSLESDLEKLEKVHKIPSYFSLIVKIYLKHIYSK